ncbi:MAG: hypothetical protein JSS14_29130 [Proteobacteria bacterium]|nr:hypothetical protein [Pseudomonadota bacterium]
MASRLLQQIIRDGALSPKRVAKFVDMDLEQIKSLAPVTTPVVSAIAALGGVYLGNRLTIRREEKKEQRDRERSATFLAVQALAHLERFIAGCLSVAYDDGTEYGRPSNGDYHQATVDPPSFEPDSLDVDWKSLPTELMYRILEIPYLLEQIQNRLSDERFDDPPDYHEYFLTRRMRYAELGLEVHATAEMLRGHARLPQRRTADEIAYQVDALDSIREGRAADLKRFESRLAQQQLKDAADWAAFIESSQTK